MEYRIAETAKAVKSSAVREILKLTQNDAVISFAGGLPAEELFPREALQEAFSRVFASGNHAMQYGLTEGFPPLREVIGERMKAKNMAVQVKDLLLTTGSQQAIDLFARVMLQPGDVILTENPTYLAALQVFHFHNVRIVAVKTDRAGMDPTDLAEKIQLYKPKFLYVIPTFANPTGGVWSLRRRQEILALSQAHGVLILEDDPYGEIQFHEQEQYQTLFSLDDKTNRIVLYTSTFSKTVVPALRIGWIAGPPEIVEFMKRAKQAADLHSSAIDQQALHQLLMNFDLDSHIRKIRQIYRERMQHMIVQLQLQRWPAVTWNEPQGGMFLWLELAPDIDAEELLKLAVREGVAFVPGSEFYVGNSQKNTLRLNYSHSSKERISQGIERLAKALRVL